MKLDFIDVAEWKRHRYARKTFDFILVRMEAETVLFGRFIGNSRIAFQSKNTMPLDPLSRYQQRKTQPKWQMSFLCMKSSRRSKPIQFTVRTFLLFGWGLKQSFFSHLIGNRRIVFQSKYSIPIDPFGRNQHFLYINSSRRWKPIQFTVDVTYYCL